MAVETSKYPPHVAEAIQAIDLPASALRRAKAGAAWLDANAPLDWRLQMMSIINGKVVSHVRICRDDENPLALAFRRVSAFQRADGRVTWASLMDTPLMSDYEAQHRGFIEMCHYASNNVFIDKTIDGHYLDDAWEQVLGEYRADYQPVQAYPRQVEAAYMLWSIARSKKVA